VNTALPLTPPSPRSNADSLAIAADPIAAVSLDFIAAGAAADDVAGLVDCADAVCAWTGVDVVYAWTGSDLVIAREGADRVRED
jgi:hypothetical protein